MNYIHKFPEPNFLRKSYFSGSLAAAPTSFFRLVTGDSSGQDAIFRLAEVTWSVRSPDWFRLESRRLSAALLTSFMESATLRFRGRQESCWGFSGVLELNGVWSRTFLVFEVCFRVFFDLKGIDEEASGELIADEMGDLWGLRDYGSFQRLEMAETELQIRYDI